MLFQIEMCQIDERMTHLTKPSPRHLKNLHFHSWDLGPSSGLHASLRKGGDAKGGREEEVWNAVCFSNSPVTPIFNFLAEDISHCVSRAKEIAHCREGPYLCICRGRAE